MFEGGKLGIAVGHPSRLELHSHIPDDIPIDRDVFFTPALRTNEDGADGSSKSDVVGSLAVWVDVDDERLPRTTLPYCSAVRSGHGYHLYWFLKSPVMSVDTLEAINRVLLQDVPTGDKASWNANRVLRVPGTINTKRPIAEVLLTRPPSDDFVYTLQDFSVLANIDRKARHKIKTGDRRGYKSRSERDWAVVVALVNAGASDELIALLFLTQPVGDKVRDKDTASGYLQRTIEKVRTSNAIRIKEQEFSEGEDGYYVATRKGRRRVSTFIVSPKLLLDGSAFGAEDAIVGDVTATGYVWNNITFSRSAFTSVRKMDAEAPVAAWQWLGNDMDVRKLLPFLMEDLVGNGLPRVAATPVLGLHLIKEVPYFVGTTETLTSEEVYHGYGGPVAWLPSKREHPEMNLSTKVSEDDLSALRNLLPKLNTPEALWPMLGWYAASPLKPWLESVGYRFPVLNVTGSRGSGKTTLIQRVMMPLFGQEDPKSYDAGTTRFVILSLLGSTNAVPIAFSEFRYESVEKFLRFVLLSYDTGHDPRGRPDQTTVDYPLMAPFSLDGEDIITDPAARQRVVVSLLTTRTVDEGSMAYKAYNELRLNFPENFGGYYIQLLLGMLEDGGAGLKKLLGNTRNQMFEAFPGKLPDRVRNNHTVALFGARLFCSAVGLDDPPASVMEQSVNTVYNTEVGRGRMLVDDLVEDVINAVNSAEHRFKWDYDAEENIVYFQLGTAHPWWVEKRRRQGRGALERDSLRQQLSEVSYNRGGGKRKNVWMYGIHLPTASESGLDVPERLAVREVRFNF
jgi:hypothetical protein